MQASKLGSMTSNPVPSITPNIVPSFFAFGHRAETDLPRRGQKAAPLPGSTLQCANTREPESLLLQSIDFFHGHLVVRDRDPPEEDQRQHLGATFKVSLDRLRSRSAHIVAHPHRCRVKFAATDRFELEP